MRKSFYLVVLIYVFFVAQSWSQDKVGLTPDMGFNLKAINSIMQHLLVDDQYAPIVSDCEEISNHAKLIAEKSPVDDPVMVAQFRAFALQLDANAQILKVLSSKIQLGLESENTNTIALKKSAALTYGQIVTSCVSCHQEFRKKQ